MTSRKDDKRSISKVDKLPAYDEKIERRVTKEVRAKADQTGEHFGKHSSTHRRDK